MIATAPVAELRLEKAGELARLSLNTHHSNEHAWQQASAIALVSIAQTLETIAARLDSRPESIRIPGSNGVPARYP